MNLPDDFNYYSIYMFYQGKTEPGILTAKDFYAQLIYIPQ